jgi:putative membrane protein
MKKLISTAALVIFAGLAPTLLLAQTTDTNTVSNSNTNTVSNPDTNIVSNPGTNTVSNTDTNTVPNTDTNTVPNTIPNAVSNTDTNSNSNTVTNRPHGNNNGSFTRADARWLSQAAAGSLHEIAAGNLAQTNSANPDVQALGALLVADHTAAYEQAAALASTNGATLPVAETRAQLRQDQQLERLTGSQFDAAFLRAMIKGHIRDIQSYEKEAQRGKSADVRAYARGLLPVLMNHLVIALDLSDALGITTK